MWWDKPGTKPKPEGKPLPFMKIRWVGFIVTGLIFLVTTVSLATQGLNMGLDFTGGVQIEATRDVISKTQPVGAGAEDSTRHDLKQPLLWLLRMGAP